MIPKPLFPIRHRTKYRDVHFRRHLATWWQWLGKIFFHRVTRPDDLTAKDALHHAIAILGETAEVRLRQSKNHTACSIGTITIGEPFQTLASGPTWDSAIRQLHKARDEMVKPRRVVRMGALK